MSASDLLSPGRIGRIETKNRVVMAPMTRSRAGQRGVPSALAIEYYRQRASAGMIITEGTAPSAAGLGYARTPTIETAEQTVAWSKITEAVHAEGGRIFCQLMHVGRIGHPANRYTDEPLVAPSAIKAEGAMWTDRQGMQPFPTPQALKTGEIPKVIEEYATATRNAIRAGFDGVELHSASGYLPMQFLSSNTNHRTDAYGGNAQNRIRFVMETLEAMIGAAGASDKIGIKIAPGMLFNDIKDADPIETYSTLVKALAPLGLAYLHVLQTGLPNTFELMRALYSETFLAGGGFTQESGQRVLDSGLADFIVYGKLFTSNPDLPRRFQLSVQLVAPNPATFYSAGAEGYTTYPML